MSDARRLLELIEMGVVEHGGDLGGWTRLVDEELQLFDGRVTLRAEVDDAGPSAADGSVHVHVFTRLHEYDDEILDACLFGFGQGREASLQQAAGIWIAGVAGPIRSLLDDKPVCMTCRAGVAGGDAAEGDCEGDYGLAGLRAFVGPSFSRGFGGEQFQAEFGAAMPWFRFAAESAAPRRVHLAKASVILKGRDGWRRELEVDGHDVSYQARDWPAEDRGDEFGYLTRFAVFEFPRNSAEIARRAELERTIRHFAGNFANAESVDHLMADMVGRGFDADLVHEAESIATIAFGRHAFESRGVRYSPTIIRARRDGRVESDVPLMSIPAYARARSLAVRLRETMTEGDFQALCLYNAESNAILQAMEAVGDALDLNGLTLFPSVVPDRGVDARTMGAALAALDALMERNRAIRKRPWWKFWRSR